MRALPRWWKRCWQAPRRRAEKAAREFQSDNFCGAGILVVWPQLIALAVIGVVFFGVAMLRFRKGHQPDGLRRSVS